MNKEIGIIVPAFHAHLTIQKLLHSISMFNFIEKVKVCIVDDCDEQKYEYLLDIFCNLDLTVLRNEQNKGPGYARNQGIQWAIKNNLPYLMFADADDYFIDFDFWNRISSQEKAEKDLFLFNFFDEQAGLNIKDIDVWSFGKIYKTKIIKDYFIEFADSYSNEDVVFNFIYFGVSRAVYMSDYSIYFWHNTPNSLSRTKDYLYYSYPKLINDLTDTYFSHQIFFPEEKKKYIVLNRAIRLYLHLNELMFSHRDILKWGTELDQKIIEALHYFYLDCYKTVEEKITTEDIIHCFREVNSGNDIVTSFIWITYFDFLNIIKEGV